MSTTPTSRLPGYEPDSEPEEQEMSLFDHLGELRNRLLRCSAAIALFACASFVYSKEAFDILAAPYFDSFPKEILIGTGPAEAFMLKLKVALFLGFLLSLPVIFYQVWAFVAPGLYEHEKRYVVPFVSATSLLFIVGVWFAYAVMLPFAFEFFQSQYASIGVTPTIRISEHLSLMLKALIGSGIIFEMPVLSFLLGRMGVIDDRMMIEGGRYAVVIIFIVAAVLTPPDVMTQLLMAGPLLILYGLSILIVRYTALKPLEESASKSDEMESDRS